MADYVTNTSELTQIAAAIRIKSGATTFLSFPDEFVSEIMSIPTGAEVNTLGYYPDSPEWTFQTSYEGVKGFITDDTWLKFQRYADDLDTPADAAGVLFPQIFTNVTKNDVTFTECVELQLEGNNSDWYDIAWGYSNGSLIQAIRRLALNPTGTLSITQNGTGIDVAAYASVDVTVPLPPDGNDLAYGYTDPTLPLVGVAQVGYAEI